MFVGNVHSERGTHDDGVQGRENSYQVCVYTEPCRERALPLFNYSRLDGAYPVDPSVLLTFFGTEPAAVRCLAISGVDQRTLKTQWSDCVAKQPGVFDRPGGGYMHHPMWRLPSQMELSYHAEADRSTIFPRLFSVREQSFSFGWPDYPGHLGDDF